MSNRSITGYHLHLYLSAFFIRAGVPNGEFPEILIAKCRSWFYCTWFFCWGDIVREINVSRAWDPVHAGDKALTRETPVKRGRVNRYGPYGKNVSKRFFSETTWTVVTKLPRNDHWKVLCFYADRKSKMAATTGHSIIDANHYDFSVIVTNFGPKLRC